MMMLKYWNILPLLALAGCATTPALTTSVAGAVPAGRAYVAVAAGKYYGAAGPDAAPIRACLGKLGVAEGKAAGGLLLQVSGTLRPARSRVIVGESAIGKGPKRPDRPSEELVVALSDAATGALVIRASAARVLGKGATVPPADGVLADALCAAMSAGAKPGQPGPAARSR
jgi:hypothetical protein